uniref:Uncharacterized protein n=1 Tax=Anopheles epiroticus TaxID=199890 RepID=A0A182PRX3_9DIPT
MKFIIALVLFAACAAQAFKVTSDCVKHPSNVERHSVRLCDVYGGYSPYDVGSNCLVKYYHPTEVVDTPYKGCGNCGRCSSCRQQVYPRPHPVLRHPLFFGSHYL